jgi:hypothetical protein
MRKFGGDGFQAFGRLENAYRARFSQTATGLLTLHWQPIKWGK